MPTSNPIGLTREQEQDFLKYAKVQEYFNTLTNQPKVAGYQPLADRFALFEGHLATVAPIAQGKVVTGKGATVNKNELKHDAARFVSVYALLSRGFCLRSDVNLPVVAANLNYSETSIFKIEDGSILQVVKAINKTIADNLLLLPLFAPYGVDAAMLAAGLAKANAFNDSLGVAGAIYAGKTATEADIVAAFDLLHVDEVQLKHIMPFFKLTDANFFNGWVAADVEDDLIRHNNVAGHVYVASTVDSGNPTPILTATVKNKKSGLVVHVDLLSAYNLHPNRAGLTEVEVSAPGFVSQTKVVRIKRGTTVDLDWGLEPV